MIPSHQIPEVSSLTERSLPVFKQQADVIGNVMKKKTNGELKSLCGVSDALSIHVKDLYKNLLIGDDDDAVSVGNSRYNQAALMFDGPAFRGLCAHDMTPEEGNELQKHLRILTGLYGYVKPGDLIQEHRLCMGTKVSVSSTQKDLYSFWNETLACSIMEELHHQMICLQKGKQGKGKKKIDSETLRPLVINCASQEYSKAVLPHLNSTDNNVRIVECVFLDGGIIKSAFAKRARGASGVHIWCSVPSFSLNWCM